MNKKGASMGLAILSALGIFIIGFMFINFLMPEVTVFRTTLDCANAAGISDGTKLLCLVGDAGIPIFILAILSLGVGAITRRFVL